MFTREDMVSLLARRPFTPFRLRLSSGATVDVISPELVLPGRRFGVIGLLDPGAADTVFDRWTTVFDMHVTDTEMLNAGPPPFSAPPTDAGSPSPSPV